MEMNNLLRLDWMVTSVVLQLCFVFTCIYNFIDSLGQLALQERVEQFNQYYQAATQHQQRGSQKDSTDLQV